ncbi:MAG: helix-turn-helix domain-containing protein [Anaerotruncus sp.]|nr:MAG: helix-turn-helix domain-containing protein [Anaerotruncus sp.]
MMISVSQVAKVLGISRTRSYELVNEKGFPKIKIGTRIVVPKDEFRLWIQKNKLRKDKKIMYANKKITKTDGKVYYMPNKIFDENFSPHEFMIYRFLVSVGDSKGVSFWSVPKMAKKCNMCPTTCRNTLKSLEEKGYIDITQRFFENAQQSNIYTVHQI